MGHNNQTVLLRFDVQNTVSVVRPSFYSERFLRFITNQVFQPREGGMRMPCAMCSRNA